MSVLKHVFVASLCHIPVALSVELQPHCTGAKEREGGEREGEGERLMEIMREGEADRQKQKERERDRVTASAAEVGGSPGVQ